MEKFFVVTVLFEQCALSELELARFDDNDKPYS